MSDLPMDENRRRFRRPLAWGLVLSVGVHLAAVLALPAPPPSGPSGGATDRDAAAEETGAPGVRLLRVRARGPSSLPVPPPIREPEPEVEVAVRLPETQVDPPHLDRPRSVRAAENGAGTAAGKAAGRSAGEGEVGGAPDGEGFVPPAPRSVAPEWDPPPAVRGQRVTLRIHVDARGRPTGPVELHPPTSVASFNRRLVRKARELRFRPARRDGRPVAAWAELTFVF